MPKQQKKRIKIGSGLLKIFTKTLPYICVGAVMYGLGWLMLALYKHVDEVDKQEREEKAHNAKFEQTRKERIQTLTRLRSSIARDVEAARKYELNGSLYVLKSPNQIVMQDGEYEFTLQFNANVVAVDGPDEAQDKQGDTFFLFKEFEDANMISDGREAGLIISAQIHDSLADSLDEEELAFMEKKSMPAKHAKEYIAALKEDAAGFLQNYGVPEFGQNKLEP